MFGSKNRGTKGDKGEKGDSGVQVRNLSNSLLVNGACENGTLSDWSNNCVQIGQYKGFLKFGGNFHSVNNWISNLVQITVRKDVLYEINYYDHSQNITKLIGVYLYDENNVLSWSKGANPLNHIEPTWINKPIDSNINFVRGFFGGELNFYTCFSDLVKKITLFMGGYNANFIISHLTLKEVEKGTPVPYYLPFLPDNQMVYDPTTNEVGLHISGQITWFASV